ncbi:S-adenosyl-L-methionine-dependent methyltransferase [Phlyctochytrium arcticum]|nr:S-adenosyl-L-methionine-dependent methyltransferase [Phlyctochytrium arcticum]
MKVEIEIPKKRSTRLFPHYAPPSSISPKRSRISIEIPSHSDERQPKKRRGPQLDQIIWIDPPLRPSSIYRVHDSIFIHEISALSGHHEIVLDDFIIVEPLSGVPSILPDTPPKESEQYLVQGTLIRGDARRNVWFWLGTYFADTSLPDPIGKDVTNAIGQRHPCPKAWITSPTIRPLDDQSFVDDDDAGFSYRLGTPSDRYKPIHDRFLARLTVAKLFLEWAASHSSVGASDVGAGRKVPSSFLAWIDRVYSRKVTDALLRQFGHVHAKYIRNVIQRHARLTYRVALTHYAAHSARPPIYCGALFEDLYRQADKTSTEQSNRTVYLTPIVYESLKHDLVHVYGVKASPLRLGTSSSDLCPDDARETVPVAPAPSSTSSRTAIKFDPKDWVAASKYGNGYRAVIVNGVRFTCGQDVMVTGGIPGFEQGGVHIARITGFHLLEDTGHKGITQRAKVTLLWYYYESDTICSQAYATFTTTIRPDYRRLILTDHSDTAYIRHLLHKVTVHDALVACRAATRKYGGNALNHYYCRSFQNTKLGSLKSYRPFLKPVFACEQCFDDPRNEARQPYLTVKNHNHRQLHVGNMVYRPGDIVSVAPSQPSSPYYEIWLIHAIHDATLSCHRIFLLHQLKPTESVPASEVVLDTQITSINCVNFVERVKGGGVDVVYVPEGEGLPEYFREYVGGAGAVFFFSKTYDSKRSTFALPNDILRKAYQVQFPPLYDPRPSLHDPNSSPPPVTPLKMFELYAGVGGLGLGLELSGACVPTWALDTNLRALSSNHQFALHPESQTLIHEDAARALKRAVWNHAHPEALSGPPNLPMPGQVGCLVAGPPCNGWTFLNRFENSPSGMINKVQYFVTLSWIEFLRPDYFIIENVFGLARKKGVLPQIFYMLDRMGYQILPLVLHAQQHGLAQRRVRIILTGAKNGLPLPKPPVPTHFVTGLSRKTLIDLPDGRRLAGVENALYAFAPGRDLKDVIGHLANIGDNGDIPDYTDPLHIVGETLSPTELYHARNTQAASGINLKKYSAYDHRRRDPTYFHRFKWTDIAPTITSSAGSAKRSGLHPTQSRGFTVREAALLQGFPPEHSVKGPAWEKFRAYGNAVPPPLAFALGMTIRRARMDAQRRSCSENES